MHILTVVGARPQFVKAAPVSTLLRRTHQETLVHTGQHYDYAMSEVFFEELGLAKPDYNLEVGSGDHGQQTGRMLERLEVVLKQERPDAVLVYGDTNSTLAGGLAAAKLHIPVAHVEAGLRSFNRAMPEEINRCLTDHLAQVLFTPTSTATAQLAKEGILQGVHQVGDVMYDVLLTSLEQAQRTSKILETLSLTAGDYVLATIHRAENSDHPDRLKEILLGLTASSVPVLFPMHPRTRARIATFGFDKILATASNLYCIEPVGYLDMLVLEQHAQAILTDSGGVQKEAYLLGVPCLTVRNETEWTETVEAGWNRLLNADQAAIIHALASPKRPIERPSLYGDGKAAERIVAVLERTLCQAAVMV